MVFFCLSSHHFLFYVDDHHFNIWKTGLVSLTWVNSSSNTKCFLHMHIYSGHSGAIHGGVYNK